MKTTRGIYLNIKESDYTFTIGEMRFYFSSQFYRNKFMMEYQTEKHRFNAALQSMYKNKFDIQFDVLAWIRLYALIEKRGFYIIIDGVEVDCVENLAFVGTLNCKRRFDE